MDALFGTNIRNNPLWRSFCTRSHEVWEWAKNTSVSQLSHGSHNRLAGLSRNQKGYVVFRMPFFCTLKGNFRQQINAFSIEHFRSLACAPPRTQMSHRKAACVVSGSEADWNGTQPRHAWHYSSEYVPCWTAPAVSVPGSYLFPPAEDAVPSCVPAVLCYNDGSP